MAADCAQDLGRVRKIVFPNSNDNPAFVPQLDGICPIAVSVSANFLGPEFSIGLRDSLTAWTTMPKATIYKNRYAFFSKNKIRGSQQPVVSTPTFDA
jgi:hypothetical protein